MLVENSAIADVLIMTPRRIGDSRGFFSEVFRQDAFEAAAGPTRFVQDNHSRTLKAGTLRGLHAQRQPRAQGKLVRVVRGAIMDVAVDVRRGSPTFGRHVAVEISETNWRQVWVPPGFLHGFLTLTDDVEILYKVTDFYSAEHDVSVAWNDPDVAVDWGLGGAMPILSDKDRAAPCLRDLGDLFGGGA